MCTQSHLVFSLLILKYRKYFIFGLYSSYVQNTVWVMQSWIGFRFCPLWTILQWGRVSVFKIKQYNIRTQLLPKNEILSPLSFWTLTDLCLWSVFMHFIITLFIKHAWDLPSSVVLLANGISGADGPFKTNEHTMWIHMSVMARKQHPCLCHSEMIRGN